MLSKYHIHFIFLVLMSFVFSACGGDDDNIVADNPDTIPEQKPEDKPNPQPEQEQDAVSFAQTLGIGWNLGNSLDAHVNGKSSETCWGNGKATQATFDAVKAMGFSTVRIPVTWMGHIGVAPLYTIERAWLDRVAEVAGYAKKAGLKAIINIHHDGAAGNDGNGNVQIPQGVWLRIGDAVKSNSSSNVMLAEITAVWKQIAERFKDEGDWLIFETFNEIHDGFWGWPASNIMLSMLNQWNQTAVNAIRSAGGENAKRYIGIPSYAASPSFAKNTFALPKDSAKDRLMVAVHTYDPYDFAGAGKRDWGHTGTVTGDATYKESHINSLLSSLRTAFVNRGIPVYIGEFGCVHRSTTKAEAFRKYYLEYNIKNMRDHRIPVMIWDNGASGSGAEKFGLVNHADGRYIKNSDIDDAEDVVALIVNAWTNTSSDYTLEKIYNNAPKP